MILQLDHLIFGNGHGMATPFFDGKFFWLEDQNGKARSQLYTWQGWFGCQLRSHQWFHPRAGERRRLRGTVFRPYNSRRKGIRVEVSWAMNLSSDINEANEQIREFRRELDLL